MAYWNKDWKPGPFPKTAAERATAAKKYGLRPEDYEPYPDDGMGYGDYPMLPRIAAEARDPTEIWDMPEIRRNYGEPSHVDADIMVEDKWNPTTKKRFSYIQMLSWLGVVWGSIIALYYISLPYPHFLPVMPKHVPFDGKPHYSFEPAD
jgi:NADH dehydrogenase (ubiquinone) 1 beta subcomplex subunit 8